MGLKQQTQENFIKIKWDNLMEIVMIVLIFEDEQSSYNFQIPTNIKKLLKYSTN